MKVLLIGFLSLTIWAKTYKSQDYELKLKEVFSGDEVIWGFDFLDEDKVIFTQREGTLWIYDEKLKKKTAVSGLPKVKAYGQGGLLDVLLEKNNEKTTIYLTYSKSVGDNITTALAVGELKGNKIIGIKDLFVAKTDSDKRVHFGSRVVIQGDYLFVSVGDRGVRNKAQDTSNHHGTIVRIKKDGTIPKDNPLQKGLKSIWSYGHRNPQGLSINPATKELWSVEFGPRGGDEINLIKPGQNYGWPVITYGKEYWGPSIGQTHKDGMIQPVKYYTPSISPSGVSFYSGSVFKKWNNHMLIAALGEEFLMKVKLEGERFVSEERILTELEERIRQVKVRSNGLIYFCTDSGKIYEISL